MSDNNTQLPIPMEEFVQAVKTATMEVFNTMLGLELSSGDMFLEKTTAVSPASGVVSLVGIAGSWCGTGSVSCSAALACKLSGQLLMGEYSSINEDVLDAMAEISNMVIGNVKTVLEEKLGASLGLSTPTVIFGRNFQTRSSGSQEWTVVPFDCEGEKMWVQLCLAPNRDSASKVLRPGFAIPQVVSF